ncbi:LuxR C-terminal-related transcriptional regulator [Patulibacter medicamentivorans]|uniref:LuxR C-terminal-related transcriptional regulator n=1 Tax=Patulibacter medicamentivorans TaxID=1097667 RepID=UPI0006820B55|nr:LuxR C-terminal-related transcriptional regulator [Patulibacter medicamentivorans]
MTSAAATPAAPDIDLRVRELTAATRGLVAADPPDPDPDSARQLIATLTTTTEQISAEFLAGRLRPDRAADLCELLVEVGELQSDLREHTLGLRFQTLHRIHEALARIRQAPSSAALIEAAPAELCAACGFDRALISRVRGSTWVPDVLHIAAGEDSEVNGELKQFLDGIEIPLTTSMLEAELVRRRAPALIHDAQGEARTFRPLIELSETRAYVVAPIVTTGPVIGFLHADAYWSGRPLTSYDRDNLQTFAEGFGLIFERAVLVERLAMQRERIGAVFSSTESMIAELCEQQVQLAREEVGTDAPQTSPAAMLTAPEARIHGILTPREREVLGLLASGATNVQIADQLVVSESTVKSHVKHILRKLRASNRAEAVSRYLRLARNQHPVA